MSDEILLSDLSHNKVKKAQQEVEKINDDPELSTAEKGKKAKEVLTLALSGGGRGRKDKDQKGGGIRDWADIVKNSELLNHLNDTVNSIKMPTYKKMAAIVAGLSAVLAIVASIKRNWPKEKEKDEKGEEKSQSVTKVASEFFKKLVTRTEKANTKAKEDGDVERSVLSAIFNFIKSTPSVFVNLFFPSMSDDPEVQRKVAEAARNYSNQATDYARTAYEKANKAEAKANKAEAKAKAEKSKQN